VPFRLLSAPEVCGDGLEHFRILIVPGGWAAHKVRALGEAGRLKIAKFIEGGGSYMGICGGAGLALSSPPALYLIPVRRMPLSERLPSASGRIYVSGAVSHPVWEDIPGRIPLSVWWPSQFQLDPKPGLPACRVACLASYADPGIGFRVADLRVCDIIESANWRELEITYGINLDPARIKGHPAIIEIEKGKGRLILSYAHLETPGDDWGNRLFLNILNYLNDLSSLCPGKPAGCSPSGPHQLLGPFCGPGIFLSEEQDAGSGAQKTGRVPCSLQQSEISRARQAAEDLIAFGEANLLWNWRRPWLLNWRRGVRGLEYGTLYVTLRYMSNLEQRLEAEFGPGSAVFGSSRPEKTHELEERTVEFCALAKRLLLEEKIATGTGTVSKIGKVNAKVDSLRSSLFGNKMNPGGLCGTLFDLIDHMLLNLIRTEGLPAGAA